MLSPNGTQSYREWSCRFNGGDQPGFTHEVPEVECYACLRNCESPLALRGVVVSKPRGIIAEWVHYQGDLMREPWGISPFNWRDGAKGGRVPPRRHGRSNEPGWSESGRGGASARVWRGRTLMRFAEIRVRRSWCSSRVVAEFLPIAFAPIWSDLH